MTHSSHILPTVIRGKCRGLIHQTRSDDCHNCGVTLIEMLVALVILSLIVGSVYVAFDSGKQSWQVGDMMLQRCQNARGALDMMSRELACALINDADHDYRIDFYGKDGDTTWRTDSIDDEVYFIARLESSAGTADLCEVGYYLSDDGILRRFYVTDNASPTNFDYKFNTPSGHTSNSQVALNVTALDFEYYNGTTWESDHEWDSTITGTERGTLPEAVRITIGVQDSKQLQDAKEFSTVVYLSRAE